MTRLSRILPNWKESALRFWRKDFFFLFLFLVPLSLLEPTHPRWISLHRRHESQVVIEGAFGLLGVMPRSQLNIYSSHHVTLNI